MKTAFLLILLMVSTGCARAHPADFRDYALRLDLADGVCSGTAVGRDVVLTASHCLKDNRITAINGRPAFALKAIHDGSDHVLVRVSVRFKHWAQMGKAPIVGDRVRWIGMPAGMDRLYREGYVSRVYTDEIYLDAQAFGGDSGSGVFCSDGRICGVVSAGKVWQRGAFTFAVTVLYPIQFTRAQWQEIA